MSLTSDAARQLSALGASKGGRARAASLSPAERSRIARSGADARWGKKDAGTPASRREYAVVTPEVKAWMDADSAVTAMLAALCARPDRDWLLERITDMVQPVPERGPDDWLSARGALADVWDGEPAEVTIRRIRDGEASP